MKTFTLILSLIAILFIVEFPSLLASDSQTISIKKIQTTEKLKKSFLEYQELKEKLRTFDEYHESNQINTSDFSQTIQNQKTLKKFISLDDLNLGKTNSRYKESDMTKEEKAVSHEIITMSNFKVKKLEAATLVQFQVSKNDIYSRLPNNRVTDYILKYNSDKRLAEIYSVSSQEGYRVNTKLREELAFIQYNESDEPTSIEMAVSVSESTKKPNSINHYEKKPKQKKSSKSLE
ncbi:MAG: hypothetical protein SFU98_19455 [Leptospiraceae bacterium]|nr:hypothetical protein [Leptospiraceae bacterium]